jgi:hypothetical protein
LLITGVEGDELLNLWLVAHDGIAILLRAVVLATPLLPSAVFAVSIIPQMAAAATINLYVATTG